MIATIGSTRCQGRWKGDADGSAGWVACPYFSTANGLFCGYVGHHFEGWRVRRLKGCAFGRRAITIRVEVEA